MPPPKIIKSVELPHDPDKAREVIADLKQLAAQHKEAKVVANNYEAKIFQPLAEALAENEAKANSQPEKLKRDPQADEEKIILKKGKRTEQTKLSKQQRAILAALREQSPLAIKTLYESRNLVAQAPTSRAISRLQDRGGGTVRVLSLFTI